MSDTLRRLREAPPGEFTATVEAALAATHERWSVEASPPSPAGGFDVVLDPERGTPGRTRLVHVRQYGSESAVGVPPVSDLAEFRDRRGAGGAALLTTGRVSDAAAAVAAEEGVEVVAGEALAGLVRDSGVPLPDREGESARSDPVAVAERLAGYWPDPLRERAAALVRAIDGRGAFEHRTRRATASTELEFVPEGGETALAKVRFTETSLLAFVRDGNGYERVVALTVHRERPLGVADLVTRIEDALDRAGRRRN